MKKTIKLASILLSLLLIASLLGGCVSSYMKESTNAPTNPPATQAPQTTKAQADTQPGGSEAQPSEGGETQAPETVPEVDISGTKLEVWYAVSGDSATLFNKQAEQFAKDTGVVLEMSYSGGSSDTATKVAAALLNDTYPDVALMYAGPLYTGGQGNYKTKELVQRPDFDMDDIYEGVMDYCTYLDQGVCAIPYGISTQVMYYNKDVLAAAGVDMTNPPRTWSEFYDVCKTVLEKGSGGRQDFRAFDTNDEAWLFKSMLMQNGCEIIQLDGDHVTPIFNNEKGVEVGEFWYSLIDSGIMSASEHSNAENNFLGGSLAFIAASSNRISRWAGTTQFEIGAIEMPYFTQPSLALGGNVLVILTQDEAKIEAAWKFVTYLSNMENNTEFALGTGYLPIHKSALNSEAVKKAISENELYAVAFKQLDYTWAYTHFEQMGTMDLQIKSTLNRLEKGRGTAQELLDKAVTTLQKEIDDK